MEGPPPPPHATVTLPQAIPNSADSPLPPPHPPLHATITITQPTVSEVQDGMISVSPTTPTAPTNSTPPTLPVSEIQGPPPLHATVTLPQAIPNSDDSPLPPPHPPLHATITITQTTPTNSEVQDGMISVSQTIPTTPTNSTPPTLPVSEIQGSVSPTLSTAQTNAPTPTGTPANSQGSSAGGTRVYLPTPDDRSSLESLERQEEEHRSLALKLEKQADSAISSLGNMTNLLLGFLGYTTGSSVMASFANRGHYSCKTGVGLTTVAIICFGLGFGFSFAIAAQKIHRVSDRVKKLDQRGQRLLRDAQLFRAEFRRNQIWLSSDTLPVPGDESRTVFETAFGRRLASLTTPPNHGGIAQIHKHLLKLLIVEAFLISLVIFLMTTVVFCSTTGDGGETPALRDF